MTAPRDIVAEFHKDSGGRLTLFSLTAVEHATDHDGREYYIRRTYDVNLSRQYGYLFHQSGAGGSEPIPVSGIYFASDGVEVEEGPTTLVDPRDRPPWRGKKTRAIRKRNRTRRLHALPKAFALEPGWDLLDWLRHNAIEQDAVYCATCRDDLPGDDLCEHCWWCGETGWYSTPSERCNCKNRDECDGIDALPEGEAA